MGKDPSPNPPTAADYPRFYRIRTGWRLAMAGFALLFFGFAGALWYFEMGDGAENPDLRLIMFGILAIPLLMGAFSLPYAIGARPILILNLDSVERQGFFLTRRLHRQEIAGYRIHNQGFSLYEIILEPKNERDKPVTISSVLFRDDVLNEWLDSLTNLDLVDEQAAIAEIAADPTLGATAEERLERLENARLVGLASTVVGYSVAGWALFFPKPYDIAMGVAAFLPWIAVAILAIWPHMFRLDGKEKDQHAQLFGLFYVPGFALLIRVILDIDVMDWRMPIAVGLIAGACMASFALVADRGAPFRLGTLVAVFFLMVPYGYGVTQFGNKYFDRAPPQQFLATVQGKHINRGKVTTYQIELGAWGPHEGPNEIHVPKADYEQLGTRNAVCVRVGPGALGMAYQYLVHSSWCTAEAKAPVGSQKGNMGPRSILSELVKPIETTRVAAGVAAYQRRDYKAALKLLEEPAADGKAEAQFMLGLLHWEGSGTPKDYPRAMKLFHLAAAQGHARAMNIIGYSRDHGIGVRADAKTALKWYRKAAALGEARAINNLAILHRNGRGVPKDLEKASDLWRRAAKQDHGPAMNNLGVMYATGKGIPKDMEKAVHWWRRAARVGDRNGAWMLARFLLSTPDNPSSLEEAVQMARQAGHAGVVEAAYVMSLLHREGRGVPRIHQDYLNWLDHAARLGHPVAAVEKGIFFNGAAGNKKHGEAVRMFRQAAARGYARGQALLGQHYESGLGITRDQEKAIALYRKAADQGDALGQRQLGFAYHVGNGVARDGREAVRLYRLAAQQGDIYAAYNLSLVLQQGKIVSQDVFESFKWSRLAAEKGHPIAINNVAFSYSRGIGVTRNITAALAYYRQAALYGQPNALHSLAGHYLVGKGVEQDLRKAYYWILLAERFYPTPRERARLSPLKQKIESLLSDGNMDVSEIERKAAGFQPKVTPEHPLPPAKPYQSARQG